MLYGVNLAGGELNYGTKNTVNPVNGTDFQFVTNQDIDYLASKKINFARLLISWEVLQQTLNAPITTNTAYFSQLDSRITYLTSKGITVCLEIHGASDANFGKYKGQQLGSSTVPVSAFADFWARMASIYKSNPKVVFGMMNEPLGLTTMGWFGAVQAAINSIRGTGATNLIMVPGIGYSASVTWQDTWYDTASPKVPNSQGYLSLRDSGNNMCVSVHMYYGTDGSGTTTQVASATIGVERLTGICNWARTNGVKVHVGEFGASAANSLSQTAVANTMKFMNDNPDVFCGAAWWAYGNPAWWGSYQFTLSPSSNYTVDDVKWSWLAPHLASLAPVDTGPGFAKPTFQPIALDSNGFFRTNSGQSPYIGYKPPTYNPNTPMPLFVWMHGCGGQAEGDMWTICPPATKATQKYIAISIGGRDGACWQVPADIPKILAAIEDVKKYFNIDTRRIILGGYSSGGDIGYRTIFFNSEKFAGIIANNTAPFLGTNASQADCIAAAKWKFNVAHIAHLQDTTYTISLVRNQTEALKSAGFPMTRIEREGTHFDQNTATSGTNYDLIKYGLPFINDPKWVIPEAPPTKPTLANFASPSVTNLYPGDQGFNVSKTVPDGYENVAKGTYTLKFATRTTYSGQNGFCVNITITNDHEYDISWNELTLDLRNHTLSSFGSCQVTGTSGMVTVQPVAASSKVPAKSKISFNMCFNRAKDDTNYYQVLVKSVKW